MIIEFVSLMWYNENNIQRWLLWVKKLNFFNFKVLLATFSFLLFSMNYIRISAIEENLVFQNQIAELYDVDIISSANIRYSLYIKNPVDKFWKIEYRNGISYSGYLYFIKIINKRGKKYALYKGKLYGRVAPTFRRKLWRYKNDEKIF